MKIYRITESDNTQWVMPRVSEDDILSILSFDCEQRNDELKNIRWYVFDPKTKPKNFYCGVNGALVFNQQVYDSELLMLFEMAGEIIPLTMETGETIYALNVLECINIIDNDKTIWDIYDDGTKGRILQYSFHHGVSESSLFKIPETSRIDVLTYSGVKDSSDEFYSLYKKSGFTGLEFKEIYPLHA
jgi:hypothetical protein